MEIIILQVFVSLMLVVGSLIAFAYSTQRRDYEHADRLTLFPLEPEVPSPQPSESSHDHHR